MYATTLSNFALLAVIVVSFLVSCQGQIHMTDLTDPSAFNKYSPPSLSSKCSFFYTLLFSQDIDDGVIIVEPLSPIISTELISQSTNKYVYLVKVTLAIGESSFDVKASSSSMSVINTISYVCEAPPTTLDIQFFNDTLYDSYDLATSFPILMFKVNNFFRFGSLLTATISTSSFKTPQVSFVSENIYKIWLEYTDDFTQWAYLSDDFNVSVTYSENPSWAPASIQTIKSNYKSNTVESVEYSIYGIDSNNFTKNAHVHQIVEFTATQNIPSLWYFKANLSYLIRARGLICMGNYTNGVVMQMITYDGPQQAVNLNFIYNNNTPSIIDTIITFNYQKPTYIISATSTSLNNGILSSSVSTNEQILSLSVNINSYSYLYSSDGIYPYGILLRTSDLYTRIDEFYASPHSYGLRQFQYGAITTSFDFGTSGLFDKTPPNIESIEQFKYGNIIVYRVHITDDKSGFYEIAGIGNYVSLVSGTLLDGIYEFKSDLENNYYLYPNDIRICDAALNCKSFDIPTFKATDQSLFKFNEFKSFSEINRIYWKYNDIDVSQQGLDNILYICCSKNITYQPHILPVSAIQTATNVNTILGIYNNSNGCYEFNVQIQKNYITGSFNAFYLWLDYQLVIYSSFIPIFGPESELRIKSINGDALGPLITDVELLQGKNVQIQSDTNITWRFTIQDDYNGFKSGLISIINEKGWVRYNFTLTPTAQGHLISGDQYIGVYEISVPVNAICVSQKYSIYYIRLEDNFERTSLYQSYDTYIIADLYTDVFTKVQDNIDTLTSISINCNPPPVDIDPPILTSFDFEPKIIDTTYSGRLLETPRMVTFNFQVTDVVGILKESLPVIYLSDQYYDKIQQTSELVSYSTTSATYTCKFNIPFGYGYPNGIKVSVYGFVDFNNNIGGYSITNLNTTYPNTIEVVQTINPSISILSTTKLYSNQDFYVMGTNFDSNDQLMVQDSRNSSVNISSISSLKTIAQFKMGNLVGEYVYISIRRETSPGVYEYSNMFKVLISSITPDSSESSTEDSSLSSSSSSPSTSFSSSTEDSSSSTPILPTNAPQQCINKCSGNGECTPSGCICKPLWIGLDCSSKVIIVNPTINTTLPSTNITIPTTSGSESVLYAIISIVQLNELNNNGDVINSYPFTQWIASNNTNSKYSQYTSTSYLYTTNITNKYDQSTTHLNVSIDYFNNDQAVNITFANQVLTMNPYSLKYSVNISQYSFSSSLNTLQVVLSASLESDESDECSSIQTGNTVESESEFIKMQVNDHSLYGRFIKRGIVDGRIGSISNTPLNTEFKSTSSKSQTHIGITVPHYKRMVQLDPDFSVLIDNKAATVDSPNSICAVKSKSKLTGAQIAGIVIGCVAFATIAVICVVYYFYKKKKGAQFLKNMNNKLENMQ